MAAQDRGRTPRSGKDARRKAGGRAPPPSPATPRVRAIAGPALLDQGIALGAACRLRALLGQPGLPLHTIGNYAVETDFYWKYGPAARDLLRGVIDIANYDSKGWELPGGGRSLRAGEGLDVFQAGQLVALSLSAVATGWLAYRLHRSLLGPGRARGVSRSSSRIHVRREHLRSGHRYVLLRARSRLDGAPPPGRAPKAWAIAVSGAHRRVGVLDAIQRCLPSRGCARLPPPVIEGPARPWGPVSDAPPSGVRASFSRRSLALDQRGAPAIRSRTRTT
jgi:hypothetical protein